MLMKNIVSILIYQSASLFFYNIISRTINSIPAYGELFLFITSRAARAPDMTLLHSRVRGDNDGVARAHRLFAQKLIVAPSWHKLSTIWRKQRSLRRRRHEHGVMMINIISSVVEKRARARSGAKSIRRHGIGIVISLSEEQGNNQK